MDQISDKKNREENWIEDLSLKEAMKRLDPEHQEIKNTNQDKYCLWRKEIL